MLRGAGNIVYPAHTGAWFDAPVSDVRSWQHLGFMFEFKTEQDAKLVADGG
jgi:branched-subunit amino acid permease